MKVQIFLTSLLLSGSAFARNDEFYAQQWALSADGQQFVRDFDDVTSERARVASGVDIGWKEIADKLSSMMKRDSVVAVLDSGLDLEHPDIASQILRNRSECTSEGLIDPQAKIDKDGNGFVGDCLGWNFAAAGNGNARPYDSSGHGTHVAGIIAAIGNNGMGIVGVAPRVRILPVKVIDNSENSETPVKTEVFARAIRYAADRNVDVINMSLGWPLSMQTPELISAIQYALAKNITLVAAAGNNGHGNPTFPCAMRGVLCVGALAPEGTLAEFSNFGGAVDLLAPGEFIYSLYPKTLRPVVSGVQGYELKNGSSQAAPFVSAAAAILRGVFPGISNSEVRARLVASTKWTTPLNAATPTMHGSLDLASALSIAPQPVVEPVFKELSQIVFSSQDNRFSFSLPIVNSWAAVRGDVRVVLRAPEESIVFDRTEFVLSSLSNLGEATLQIAGRLADVQVHCEVPLAVDIVLPEGEYSTYRTTLFLARSMEGDAKIRRVSLPDVSGFSLTDSNGTSLLRTVTDKYNSAEQPEYFLTSASGASGSMRFVVLKPVDGSYVASRTYEIPNAQRILNFVSLDANRDGRRDYLVQSIVKTATGVGYRLDWLDENLEPLYGSKSIWNVRAEGAVLSANFGFLKFNDPDFGTVSLPVFSDVGPVPRADRFIDPFDPNASQDNARHLYFINPIIRDGVVSAETRILDTNALRSKVLQQLADGAGQAIVVAGLVPQSASDFAGGRLNALLMLGSVGSRTPYVLTLKGYNSFDIARVSTLSGENLSENALVPLRYLNGQRSDFAVGASLVTLFDPHRARTLTFQPKTFEAGNIVPRASAEFDYRRGRRDLLLAGLGAFEDALGTTVFYQSKRKLLMQYIQGNKVAAEFEAPLYRYSFLPGAVFNQMFFPVAYGTGSNRFAAFYTDNAAISRNSVQLVVASKSGLSRPANMSIAMSSRCQPLNPARLGQAGDFSYVFHCGQELRFLLMSR